MLPGRAAIDVRNNYFVHRAQRALFVDVIAVRNFLTANLLLTHVHLGILQEYKIFKWIVIGARVTFSRKPDYLADK